MHRTIEITVSSDYTDSLIEKLAALEDVITLSVSRGASLKPVGDIITVHTLNRGADDVLKLATAAQPYEKISIATSELASLIHPSSKHAVHNDVDEAIWEEMETGLRHQGRVTPNYIILMALGGSIATVGLVSEPVPQAIAFVSSAIIAPGFEPIAKIPIGFVLRNWTTVRQGLVSVLVGYLVLILAGAITFWLMQVTGNATVEDLITNPEVLRIAHPTGLEISISICGALAGILMIAAYRRSVIAGPLIALILIPAAALVGAAFVAQQMVFVGEGVERFGIDALLIIIAGALVTFLKQATVHHRQPIV